MRLITRGRLCLAASLAVLTAALPGPASALGLPAPGDRPEMSAGFQRDLERLNLDTAYGAFIHFPSGTSRADEAAAVSAAGLTITSRFESVDVVFATGRLGSFAKLLDDPLVTYLEDNYKVETFGDTGPWATRARVAHEDVGKGPYFDASGNVIDGRGVGVAVIDTGVDSTHPDLAGRIAKNFKVVCSTPALISTVTGMCFGPYAVVEHPYSDASGGHGTHVAGIVAGDGTASQGTFRGAAPGASLYGYGVGEGDRIFSYSEAFDHILDNLATFSPAIKVINNSWGDPGGTAFNPNGVFTKLVDAAVDAGITVTFAAGNDGGNGNADLTSSHSKNPKPGVISVANYNDANTGTRSGQLSNTSSRGANGTASTYPDISAPGSTIVSTCRPVMPICNLGIVPTIAWAPNYSSLSGTSMAAPHVAGIAALLYQAKPDIIPAQVEDVLQDTAFKFGSGYRTDPQNQGGTTSFDKGAGLVDAQAALDALGVAHDQTPQASPHVISEDGAGDAAGPGSGDIVSLSVVEEAAGLRYTMTLADASDVGPATSYWINQIVDGRSYRTELILTPEGPEATEPGTSNTLVAQEVALDGNDITYFVPFSAMGDPQHGAPVFKLWASSYEALAIDTAPGGAGVTRDVQPLYGEEFTIQRGGPVDPTPSPTASPSPTPTPTTSSSPSPEPSPTPTTRTTTVSFAPASATGGDYGDTVQIEARVLDQDGAPVVNQGVAFELRGTDGIRWVSGVTDGQGSARIELNLDVVPDLYSLSASYPGQTGVYAPSDTRTDFTVARETTVASLNVTGKGAKKTLEMSLVDHDQVLAPVAGAFVTFFADGENIGSATTGRSGTVSYAVPSKYRGGSHTFEVVYDGDAYYLPSSATASS